MSAIQTSVILCDGFANGVDAQECEGPLPPLPWNESASLARERAKEAGWTKVTVGKGGRIADFCPSCAREVRRRGGLK